MDWQLRIALIIAGCALVGYVYYDYSKKKRLQKENEKLKRQFGNISETVDSAGFDHVGVGTPRLAAASDDDDERIELNQVSKKTVIKGSSVEEFIDRSAAGENSGNLIQNDMGKLMIDKTTSVHDDDIKDTKASVITGADHRSTEKKTQSPEKAMVLSLTLQAPQGTQFKSKDFLPLFLSQGLRHGEMGIFHRRTRAGKEPGPVLFSLANGIAPGTFDINNMENFGTPALACFVTLPGPEDAQVAYNAMYKTCVLLQKELGGEILDETKSIYSKQTHNHRLDQIKDYSFKFGV